MGITNSRNVVSLSHSHSPCKSEAANTLIIPDHYHRKPGRSAIHGLRDTWDSLTLRRWCPSITHTAPCKSEAIGTLDVLDHCHRKPGWQVSYSWAEEQLGMLYAGGGPHVPHTALYKRAEANALDQCHIKPLPVLAFKGS